MSMAQDSGKKNDIEFYFKNFGDAEYADVETEIRTVVADVKAGRYDDELKDAGINHNDLAQIGEMPYNIRGGQKLTGFEWEVVQIAVQIAGPVVTTALIDVWSHIIFPRLEQRYGSGRICKEMPKKD
jgi:hypothetical protein